LDLGKFIRSFEIGEFARSYLKGVVFADKAHAIVGGSDHGRVYIYDLKTGKMLKTLQHAQEGGVETVAVQLSVNCKDHLLTAH